MYGKTVRRKSSEPPSAALSFASMKFTAGTRVGPYEVVEQVGKGGMATVYKAYQPALERMVAIKVLPEILAEDEQFRERFRREAVAIARLRHPNILAVFDHGEFEGQLYIVTEFVEGGTFAGELGRPLSLERAVSVLEAIASALDYAHQQGVLHRDVKPSNILINKQGAAILGDFGLARMMATTGERLTRLDMVVGTPEYMSPEQCAGREAGPAGDQYSLAVVAFEALTGHVPFEAETPAAVMLEQIQSPLPMPRAVNPALSEGVERVLLKALAKEPGGRFATCLEFIKALTSPPSAAQVAASTAVSAKVAIEDRSVPLQAKTKRPAWAVPAAAAVVVVLAIGGLAYFLSGRHPNGVGAAATSGPTHGQLLYAATPSRGTWSGGVEPSPDPASSMSTSYGQSSIDIHILKSGAGLSAGFDGPALKNYVAEFLFNVDAGSDFEIDWQLIGAAQQESAEVDLNIETAQEAMTLYLSPYNGSNQTMVAAIPIPHLQSGATVDLWVSVSNGSVTLYLGSRQVGHGSETQASGPSTPGFYMGGNSGTLHIQALRYYALS